MTSAREAILRYFADPPKGAPEDLEIVFTRAGRPAFVPAAGVVEITPPLPVSNLPGGASGVAFWRGKAYEVRGSAAAAKNFLLVRDSPGAHFVVSESIPRAVSRAESKGLPEYRGNDAE